MAQHAGSLPIHVSHSAENLQSQRQSASEASSPEENPRRRKLSMRKRKSLPRIDVAKVQEDAEDPKTKKFPPPPAFSNVNICSICDKSLGMRKFKHNCRNCGKSVCGNHSRNYMPLPHFGIIKAVRVCDKCTITLVQRRVGYKSPRAGDRRRASSQPSPKQEVPILGIVASAHVEIVDSMMDDLLYLGTLRRGSRSLATRNLNANIAIFKERLLLLTHAEILCFKPSENSELGEVKATVHMTDILHIEIHVQYPRVLNIIRSDGRIFRMRLPSEEECNRMFGLIESTRHQFQKAMHNLQRGPQDEDNRVTLVTVRHAGSLPAIVVSEAPNKDDTIELQMYPSSFLQVYLAGRDQNCVAKIPFSAIEGTNNEELSFKSDPIFVPSSSVYPIQVHLRAKVQRQAVVQELLPATIALSAIALNFRISCPNVLMLVIAFLLGMATVFAVIVRNWSFIQVALATKEAARPSKVSLLILGLKFSVPGESFDEDEIPDDAIDIRYIEGCRGDLADARFRYLRTLKWRRENNIDAILLQNQPNYYVMKECYQKYIHKRDKAGHPIVIDCAGNLKKNLQDFMARGVSQEEAVMHHVFLTEYLWKVIDSRPYPEGLQLQIIDLKGISFSDIGGEVVEFVKKCGAAIGDNNPERLWKVFIVNPPSWFNILWKVVSPLINPKTRDKTHVVRGQKEIEKALLQWIDPENLPAQYGGSCECEGGCDINSPESRELDEYVQRLNQGEDMEQELETRIQQNLAKLDAQYGQTESKQPE